MQSMGDISKHDSGITPGVADDVSLSTVAAGVDLPFFDEQIVSLRFHLFDGCILYSMEFVDSLTFGGTSVSVKEFVEISTVSLDSFQEVGDHVPLLLDRRGHKSLTFLTRR